MCEVFVKLLGEGSGAGADDRVARPRADVDATAGPIELQDAVDATRSNETASGVLLGAAGGLAALGVLFHVLDDDGLRPTAAALPDGTGGWAGVASMF